MYRSIVLALLAVLAGCASAPPPEPDPTPPPTPANVLGDAAMEAGDHRQAIVHYTTWLDANPQDAPVTYRRARCHEHVGDHPSALTDYTRVLELEDGSLPALLRRAGCYARLGRLESAEKDLRQVFGHPLWAESNDRTRALAHGLAGQVHLLANRPVEALRQLDQALALADGARRPVRERLLYNRSAALFEVGAYEEAQQTFEAYAASKADAGEELDAEESYHLCLLAYLAGDYARARQLLPRLDPDSRRGLAARLHDPDFFLTRHELHAAMARANNQRGDR